MLYRVVSLGSVDFSSHVWERQAWWRNPYDWQPVGQTRRLALAGNPYIVENSRGARPIELAIEHPYAWLRQSTVIALDTLVASSGTLALVLLPDGGGSITKTVAFDRAKGPLKLAARDEYGDRYTGSIYLIETG